MNTLSQALRLSSISAVAFVGAGGKTSAMFQAAKDLGNAILTTTTHIGDWQTAGADKHIVWNISDLMPGMDDISGQGIILITGLHDVNSHRYSGLSLDQMEKLYQYAGYHDLPLLIEADGSRQISIKAPGENEPVIPEFTNLVVVTAGLSCLGKKLTRESVFRMEKFSDLTGLHENEIITTSILAELLIHPLGGLKNIPYSARRSALLNQADNVNIQSLANETAELLVPVYDSVIISSLLPLPAKIYSVKEKTDGV